MCTLLRRTTCCFGRCPTSRRRLYRPRSISDVSISPHIITLPPSPFALMPFPLPLFADMVAWGQANIVNKFVPGLGGNTDPVGPSPVIIHKDQLVKLAKPWYDMTIKICADGEAVQALGWVRGCGDGASPQGSSASSTACSRPSSMRADPLATVSVRSAGRSPPLPSSQSVLTCRITSFITPTALNTR